MMALVAYMTRALQLLVGSSKLAQTQRAEELDQGLEQIPLAGNHSVPSESPPTTQATTPAPSRPQTPPQLRLQDHHHGQGSSGDNVSEATVRPAYPSQDPIPPPRSERWAALIAAHIDTSTFAVLLVLVGLPVYYATGYTLPLHITLNTLSYIAAMSLPPPSWRTYLHPVLTSSLLTVLLIWAFSATRGTPLHDSLDAYRTGAKYLQLWRGTHTGTLPGAGDLFATLLDASITALALPTFQHRRELRDHLAPLLLPSVLVSVASLLAYPPLCAAAAVGISPARSLAFASRSLTLALATPATENLGGDVNTAAALAIVSGILGVLCGQRVLAVLRIPEDDYVTRGITLGINSSAIATALLLRTDPRAAALSCLAMILFGTVTVVFTSIPPVADVIRSFAGL